MKLCLCIMFHNEIDYLKLHLPTASDTFDGIVGLTDPSCTDGSIEWMRSIGADVAISEWKYDWGDFATQLIRYAESLGYEGIMRIDGDECVMPDTGDKVRHWLTNDAALLIFPRHEFYGDRQHVRAEIWPDYQSRAWRLNRGIIVQGKRHEGIRLADHGLAIAHPDPNCRALKVSSSIYHYGWASPQGILRGMRRYENHARIEAGLEALPPLSPDTPLMVRESVPFTDPQPLDPELVGIHAPFGEK